MLPPPLAGALTAGPDEDAAGLAPEPAAASFWARIESTALWSAPAHI